VLPGDLVRPTHGQVLPAPDAKFLDLFLEASDRSRHGFSHRSEF
jgi:hypothetical protein